MTELQLDTVRRAERTERRPRRTWLAEGLALLQE
jgi:hypothetical protein